MSDAEDRTIRPTRASRRRKKTNEALRRTTSVAIDKPAPIFFISTDVVTSEKIVQVLEKRGINCITFTRPFDAVSHESLKRTRAIVMDLRNPTGDDISLYKIIRNVDSIDTIPFIFLVEHDAKLSARASGISMMDQYLTMPVSASILCDTIHHAIVRHKRRTRVIDVKSNIAMRGDLKEITLPELIQLFQIGRKTGLLHVKSPHAKGVVAFVNGEIHHAEIGPIEGDEAFYLLMAISEGSFEFEANAQPSERTIMQNITNLLLEGMRQLDEVKSLLDQFSRKATELEKSKNKQRTGNDTAGLFDGSL